MTESIVAGYLTIALLFWLMKTIIDCNEARVGVILYGNCSKFYGKTPFYFFSINFPLSLFWPLVFPYYLFKALFKPYA